MNDNYYSDRKVYFNDCSLFYIGYIIKIYRSLNFNLNHINPGLPYLYSEKQTIKIEDNKENYELKFKIDEYNDQLLYLSSNNYDFIYLDNCNKDGYEIICKIEKEYLEEVLQNNLQAFDIFSYHKSFGKYKIGTIDNIIIIDNSLQKQEIYVGIIKLLQQSVDNNNYVAYETNVTNISNVISGQFTIPGIYYDNLTCYLKKSEEVPLLFLCKWNYNWEQNKLGEIKKEILLNDICIKYNFRIQPVNNNDIFSSSNSGNEAYDVYPKILNFSSDEAFTLIYFMDNPSNTKGLRLNPNFEDLDCYVDDDKMSKSCFIYKEYFKNEKSGYYYTYQEIFFDNYTILYELSPIQVILPNTPSKTDQDKGNNDSNNDTNNDTEFNYNYIIVGSAIVGMALIALLIFLILKCKNQKSIKDLYSYDSQFAINDDNDYDINK